MLMREVLNATDVRKDWGKFIDTVVHEKPKIVKRNRDYFLSLSLNHVDNLLKDVCFKVTLINEDDGSVTATLENLDLVVNAENEIAARKAMAEELLNYAKEYFEEFQLYYNSLNRRPHFPYVLKVLIQKDLEGIIGLLHA